MKPRSSGRFVTLSAWSLLGFLAGNKTGTEEIELAEALGLTPPLVRYHLEVLQSADLVAHVEGSEPTDRYVVAPASL